MLIDHEENKIKWIEEHIIWSDNTELQVKVLWLCKFARAQEELIGDLKQAIDDNRVSSIERKEK